jgi:hypothetical protein
MPIERGKLRETLQAPTSVNSGKCASRLAARSVPTSCLTYEKEFWLNYAVRAIRGCLRRVDGVRDAMLILLARAAEKLGSARPRSENRGVAQPG